MKQLKDILFGVQIEAIRGSTSQSINAIKFDSREVETGDLFVAVKGDKADGHDFIEKAIANGALAIVYQNKVNFSAEKVVWIETNNSRAALAILASNFYECPSSELKLIGGLEQMGRQLSRHFYTVCLKKRAMPQACYQPLKSRNYLNEIIPTTHTTQTTSN